MYRSLNHFLRRLESEGELLRISAYTDPVEEIAEITERVSKRPGGGKALLFENTGTRYPVVTNLFGSEKRMSAALGVGNIDDIARRIETLAAALTGPANSAADKLHALSLAAKAAGWLPRRTKGRGECQQAAETGERADFASLPILKCREHDGGRFVTLPMVNTVDADSGARKVGMYRMQITGRNTAGMHWHIHKTGARHYESWKRRGETMPVSVCLGGDPVYAYAATAPLPEGIDEYLFAGFLRGRGVKLVKCLTNDLWVPSDCDFVLEGYVDPEEDKFLEGPFADHTGFYSLEDLYPRFHLTAVTHRRDAVWPATVVGIPPEEDSRIAEATERIFIAPIRMALAPEIEDLYMPSHGAAHNLALASVRCDYPGHAHKAASTLWGAGQMLCNKSLILTDAGTDLRDPETIARLLREADIPQSVIRGNGILDILDHATATPGFGGKLALDLTSSRPVTAKAVPETAPGRSAFLPEGCRVDTAYAEQWAAAVIYVPAGAEITPRTAAEAVVGENIKYIAALDAEAEGLSPGELLWLAAADTDPARDVRVEGGRLFIDARTKLPGRYGHPSRFPNPAVSSSRIIETVDRRWAEYGLGEFTPSPSLRYMKLRKSDNAEI